MLIFRGPSVGMIVPLYSWSVVQAGSPAQEEFVGGTGNSQSGGGADAFSMYVFSLILFRLSVLHLCRESSLLFSLSWSGRRPRVCREICVQRLYHEMGEVRVPNLCHQHVFAFNRTSQI